MCVRYVWSHTPLFGSETTSRRGGGDGEGKDGEGEGESAGEGGEEGGEREKE